MQINQRQRNIGRVFMTVCGFSTAVGGGYGYMTSGHAAAGLVQGALTGLGISLALVAFETLFMNGPLGQPLKAAPFLVYVGAKSLVYLLAIAFGSTLAAALTPGMESDRPLLLPGLGVADLAFAFAISIVINFLMAINRLLGHNMLLTFVSGRYHRPRLEERIFLFLDMADSTRTAERIGDVAFHRLVNRCFGDMSDAMEEHRGTIHRYVGDEMIVTWTMADGLRNANCVRAGLEAQGRLARYAPVYRREFGEAPAFRAALHSGTVVSGEMGSIRKEIVFLGDAVNTASRMEQVCRDLGVTFVISEPLLSRLTLPDGVAAVDLGRIRLRGREQELRLLSLQPAVAGAMPAPADA